MAIALDATGGSTANTDGLTFSHTCTGSSLILFVAVGIGNPTGVACSGVTYNGVAMTKVSEVYAQSNIPVSLWYLINPATGAHNVVISTTGGGVSFTRGASASYTGAKQSGVPDSFNTFANGTAGTSQALSTTVVANNCWLVVAAYANGDVGAGTGVTQRNVEPSSPPRLLIGDSNGTVATGSQSMTILQTTGSQPMGFVMASFALPSASTSHLLGTMGVGS
jgi:hypothetical protein